MTIMTVADEESIFTSCFFLSPKVQNIPATTLFHKYRWDDPRQWTKWDKLNYHVTFTFKYSHHDTTKEPQVIGIEAWIQRAITAVWFKECASIRAAALWFDVPPSTLSHCITGHVSRNQAQEQTQNLSAAEETELKRWITKLTRLGYPPRHQLVCEMAEEIRHHRVREINTEEIELVSYPSLGRDWTRQFLNRHPDLKTTMLKTIEVAWIKDTNPEALKKWFRCVEEEIKEFNIQPENMYNMDKSGFAIGTTQAGRAIINAKVRSWLQVHPRCQEWVSVVECICADGTVISPLVIFKGKSLSNTWIPTDVHDDWRFSYNSKG